jgi:hypothetical protein
MKNLIFYLIFGVVSLSAQGIKAEIKVDAQHLDDLPRQYVSQLARDITYYIESTQWTFEDLPDEFLIQATLYLDSYTESGYQKIYNGKAFWGNGDDQKYFDKSWQFAFNQGDALIRSTTFNSLTSFIDYWVLTILGGNLDTWSEFGGSQAYTDARHVARDGTTDQFSLGWKDRLEDLDKLSRNQNFRKMKFAYYEGIALWDSGSKDEALKQIDTFVSNLEVSIKRQDSRIFTQNFLNAKYLEISDFLWEVGNASYIHRLMKVDEDHKAHYQTILDDW